MRILAIDGDPRALELLTACLRQACPGGEIHPFANGHKALAWLERNAESNLNAYLTMGVEATELSKGGYDGEGVWPEIDYQFLQWGRDSQSMLIYYAFEDAGGEGHDGYFWYNCVEGTVQAVLELSP